MPLYFFDIHDGSSLVRDTSGCECAGPEAVRLEAMKTLPAIARDEIPKDGDRQVFMVLVRDERGAVVYTATLAFAGLWAGDTPLPDREGEPFA